MSTVPTIREVTSSDAKALLPLVQELVTSFRVVPESYQVSFHRLVQNHSALVLVAESEGELVGYSLGFIHDTFYANGPVSWLEEIMVNPAHRRSGLGGRLVKAFEAWSQENGAVLSALATRRASEFYESIGYEESASYYRRLL